jgi:transcriptional regulator with XRE-family HTH domain
VEYFWAIEGVCRPMTDNPMPTNYAQRVGERLRLIRKQKGLSLQEVEASSSQEFKASVLGAYERGERAISVPRLQRLARFYTVPVDQLLPQDLDNDFLRARGDDEVIDLTTDGESAEAGTSTSSSSAAASRPARRYEEDRVSIDLARLQTVTEKEREMLTRYLGMIQVQRQDFNGKVLTIRYEDLRAIACLFETTTDSMRRRLDELGLRR